MSSEEDDNWDDDDVIEAAETASEDEMDEDGEEEEYDYGSDGEDDPFGVDDGDPFGNDEEEEEEDQNDNTAIDLENSYYEADDLYGQGDLEEALKKYEHVVEIEADPKNKDILENLNDGPWSFKSLSKIVLIHTKQGNTQKLLDSYRKLLSIMNEIYVTTNQREEAIGDTLSNPALAQKHDPDTIEVLYKETLGTLKPTGRLWFRTSLSQARLYLNGNKDNLVELVPQKLQYLKDTCRDEKTGEFLRDRASDLLEVYEVEMNYLLRIKNFSRMRHIYPRTRAKNMTSAVEDSRTMGPLRESGGRMWLHFRNFSKAYNEFFDSFKAYEEAGKSHEAKLCIKYLVVANILDAGGHVNPFAAREISAYVQNASDVEALQNLREAFQNNDIEKYESILRCSQVGIVSDSFLKTYVEDLKDACRVKVLKRRIRPYRRVRLQFLCDQLGDDTDMKKTRNLLNRLILDGDLEGRVDEVEGSYENPVQKKASAEDVSVGVRYGPMMEWSKKLDAVRVAVNAQFDV